MKKDLTELVFILDKSGSMSGLESDTIGGFNAMLNKQKQVEGACRLSTVLFNNQFELLHDRIDIFAVSPISEENYCVGGTTSLLDAIGLTIQKIDKVQKQTNKPYRAENVLVIIITDGEENSSREYTAEQVKKMIEYQQVEYGWEFIFLGANIDAVQAAGHLGIALDRAQNYHADPEGVELNFHVMSDTVASYRESASMPLNWKEEIEQDYRRRNKTSAK